MTTTRYWQRWQWIDAGNSREQIRHGDTELSCRVSIGLAEVVPTMKSQFELVQSADQSLYAAKRRAHRIESPLPK